MDKTVAKRVKEIVLEHLGVEPDRVVPDARFVNDLGADSLDTVELVMMFEEEFAARFLMMPPKRSRPSATR